MVRWAFGEGSGLDDSRVYFGIVPGRYYAPKTLEEDVPRNIQNPVLPGLSRRDSLIGDADKAAAYAASIPHLTVEALDSGHLINVKKSDAFNRLALAFLVN